MSVGFPGGICFLDNPANAQHAVDTCSNCVGEHKHWLHRSGHSFYADLEPHKSSGFLLGEHWSLLKTPVNIPAFWQSLLVHVGFFILTKVNAFVFLLMSACLHGVVNWTLTYHASHPALRIDGQSLP